MVATIMLALRTVCLFHPVFDRFSHPATRYNFSINTAWLWLLPLALSAGKPGRELEQPMAVVILGGLITSSLINMIALPALYLKFGRRASSEEVPAPIRDKIERS